MTTPIIDMDHYLQLLELALRANAAFKKAHQRGSADQFVANQNRKAACEALTAFADQMKQGERQA